MCRKRKVGIAKSASLLLKQAVKACPIVLHKVFDFIFYGKPREKAHRDPFECLTVVVHFILVSTCVTTQTRLLSAPGYQCATYSKNPTMPLGRKSLLPCLLASRRSGAEERACAQRARMPRASAAALTYVPHLSAETQRGRKSCTFTCVLSYA